MNLLSEGINILRKLVILHVASITNDKFSGVTIVVPKHIFFQQKEHTVGLLNVRNIKIDNVLGQLTYEKDFKLDALSEPFNSPDIVVFQETYRIEYIKIARQLRKRGIPYIIVPHGELSTQAQRKKWLKKKIANMLVFRSFIKGAVAIQCLSQREMEQTTLGGDKFLATNGIEIPDVSKQCFSSGHTKFVYVGRLDAYHKGLDLMIHAVKKSAMYLRDNNCTLDIYGPDVVGRAEYLEKLITEADVSDIVKLHPPVVGQEKERVLLEADIFIQTSRFEGMPLGILESLSFGVPCLLTEGTVIGELVEQANAGWVSDNNADDIAKVLIKAIEERGQWPEKSKNARAFVSSTFEWDRVVTQAIDQYEKYISF